GGEPRRLTFHGGRDIAQGWTPDGRYVVFVSWRDVGYGGPLAYKVSPDGGYPEALPLGPACYLSFSPDGQRIAFNRQWGEFRNWKRYKGGQAQDIWLFDGSSNLFRRLTDYEGIDRHPMWVGNRIYFISDRETGVNNLFSLDPATGQVVRHTQHRDFPVYAPETDGKRIVYECGGALWIYDPSTGREHRLSIEVPSERWMSRPREVKPAKHLGDYDVSPDGKWLALEARGDIYVVAKDDNGEWRNLTQTQGARERYPAWSPDGKWVAFFSDRTGDYQLYRVPAQGGEWDPLTKNLRGQPYHLVWSPDGRYLAFGDKDYNLFLVEVESKKLVKVDRCRQQKDYEFYWEISDYSWSPDGRWLAYSKVDANLNSSVFLYDVRTGDIRRLTDDRFDDFSPAFDANGRYLYFLSQRHFNPTMDPSEDNYIISPMTRVYLVALRSGEEPPFDADEGSRTRAVPADSFRIDWEGIAGRIFQVPIPAANYVVLQAGKNKLFVRGKDEFGFPGIEEFFNPAGVQDYWLKGFDLASKKTTKVLDGIGSFRLNLKGDYLAYRSGTKLGVLSCERLAEAKVGDGAVDLDRLSMRLDLQAEWRQIFEEAWRWYRDFFYDPGMHGVDWEAIRHRYAQFLPYIETRRDLTALLSEMVGEVVASHCYVFGGEDNVPFEARPEGTGLLGADLRPDPASGYYRFVRILRGSSWEPEYRAPLAPPNVDVRPGDYLLSIDGVEVRTDEDYLKHLVGKANREVEITVNSVPRRQGARIYRVKTVSSETALRRLDWVERNRRYVEERTKGEVGYLHLPDMDRAGLAAFEREFKANKYKKGLIIDVRYNGGGFTNYFVIDKLERQLVFGVKSRDFHPMRFPMVSFAGPTVALINENTGSDGELFTEHYRARNLGKVIGKRTWGGLIGIINVIPLVDGGILTQPNVGFYDFQGHWIVENHGAEPDIEVDIEPADWLQGRDPQLEKAVETILAALKEKAAELPEAPPFPRKER
ncbi:MAG: S41 family peptidase, partial [candidate division KSB1 bacterium]|nr:S41 family peptidase [candidate division KSB1 bacterium]